MHTAYRKQHSSFENVPSGYCYAWQLVTLAPEIWYPMGKKAVSHLLVELAHNLGTGDPMPGLQDCRNVVRRGGLPPPPTASSGYPRDSGRNGAKSRALPFQSMNVAMSVNEE